MKNPLWNRFPARNLRNFLLISAGIHLSISVVLALIPDLRIEKLPSLHLEVTLLPLPVIAEDRPSPKHISPKLKPEFKEDKARAIEPVKEEELTAEIETAPQQPETHHEPVKREEFPSQNESGPKELETHLAMQIQAPEPLPRRDGEEKPETGSVAPPAPILLPAPSDLSSDEMRKAFPVQSTSVALLSDPVFDSKVLEKTRFPDTGPQGDSENVPDRSSPVEVDITITQPRYCANPKPPYPKEARKRGYQGEVMLRVEVLPGGRVGQVEVKKSSGYDLLDRSASTAVRQWKFIPATKGKEKIPFWVNIPIKFQLK